MRVRHNDYNFALLALGIVADYAIKHFWSLDLSLKALPRSTTLFSQASHWSDLHTFLLLLFSVFILLVHFLITRLVHARWYKLKYSLTLLTLSFLSLFMDLGIHSGIVEFASLSLFGAELHVSSTSLFGLAGLGMLFFALVADTPELKKMQFFRYKYLIRPKEQLSSALLLVSINFLSLFIGGSFAYSYFFVKIEKETNVDPQLMFSDFIGYFLMLAALICLISFVAAIFITHKSVGPVFAFHKFVDELVEGKRPWLRLRSDDQHKELEAMAQKLITAWEYQKLNPLERPRGEAKKASSE